MNEIYGSRPKTSIEMLIEKERTASPPPFDWPDWTCRLQQALGALLAETISQKEPNAETWDLVQGAIELEAEAASRVG